jgi:MFS family permease
LIYAIGLGAFAITYLTIGQLSGPSPMMFGVVALYGLFPALTDGVGKAVVSHSVPQLIHGKAQGVFQSLNGGAILLAGIWGGLLWTSGNGHGSLPMTIAGVGAAIGAIALIWQSRVGGSREHV